MIYYGSHQHRGRRAHPCSDHVAKPITTPNKNTEHRKKPSDFQHRACSASYIPMRPHTTIIASSQLPLMAACRRTASPIVAWEAAAAAVAEVLAGPDIAAVPVLPDAVPVVATPLFSVVEAALSVGEASAVSVVVLSSPEEESSLPDVAVGDSVLSVVVGVGVLVTAETAAAATLSLSLPSLPSALEMQVSTQ